MKKVYVNESVLSSLIMEAMAIDDIYQKYYNDIPYDSYKRIVMFEDPTYDMASGKMGRYAKWLLGMYRRGTFKEGDFNEARELLTVFEKYKNRVEVRDVTKLHSMGELYQVVKPFMFGDQATSKSDTTRRAKEGAEKVYEDEHWIVIIPHTMEAAQIYGENTRWCTAAADPDDNLFDYYNSKGNLYINIQKGKPYKYQFHFETESFMDEMDDEIDRPIFETMGATQGLINFYKERLGIIDFIDIIGDFKVDATCRSRWKNYENYINNGGNPNEKYFPKAYLVWSPDEQHCMFVNEDGDQISAWFNEAQPFGIYEAAKDPWRVGPTTFVSIYADQEDSIYMNDLQLFGNAVFNGNEVDVTEWFDKNRKERYPDWCEGDDVYGSWYVPSDEEYDESYEMNESVTKMSFFMFFNEIKKFIAGLLADPIGTKPSEVLISYGLHNGKLRKMLRDANVIQMKENIDEPYSEETGEMESRYFLSYKVPKKDFKKKLRRLYQKLFERDITESYHTPNGLMLHNNELGNDLNMRGQIDMMLNSPLTMGIACDERAPEYVKDAVKIYNDKIISKKLHNNEKES